MLHGFDQWDQGIDDFRGLLLLLLLLLQRRNCRGCLLLLQLLVLLHLLLQLLLQLLLLLLLLGKLLLLLLELLQRGGCCCRCCSCLGCFSLCPLLLLRGGCCCSCCRGLCQLQGALACSIGSASTLFFGLRNWLGIALSLLARLLLHRSQMQQVLNKPFFFLFA